MSFLLSLARRLLAPPGAATPHHHDVPFEVQSKKTNKYFITCFLWPRKANGFRAVLIALRPPKESSFGNIVPTVGVKNRSI